MTLDEIKKFYSKKHTDIDKEEMQAINDFLAEVGLAGDVTNREGKRGRLIVEREYGHVAIRFYAYTKSGRVSKLACGYMNTWNISEYKGVDNDTRD